MSTTLKTTEEHLENLLLKANEIEPIDEIVKSSWKVIAPFWPLENLIAVNPLQGLEDLDIEEALIKSEAYFQQENLPPPMLDVNRETIKWLQVYFDKGQATIKMPLRSEGLYLSWKQLIIFDKNLHRNEKQKINWLKSLPSSPKQTITLCLSLLKIPQKVQGDFLKLMLTTLHGWASYLKYRNEWLDGDSTLVTEEDYLAIRLVTTYLLWPDAIKLISFGKEAFSKAKSKESPLRAIEENEKRYRPNLLRQLKHQVPDEKIIKDAQFVFCIDVRSEPFRRSLETVGNYETFGFAGFFGIPTQITDVVTGDSYASCPVLLKPKHEVKEMPCCSAKEHQRDQKGYVRLRMIKEIYQSVKYTFSTPFAMVEGLGIVAGLWIALRTFTPSFSIKLKKAIKGIIRKPIEVAPCIDDISIAEQTIYAEGALRMIGLTQNFASKIVFCGHGSSTQNNAYRSSLDCGACGGRHGSSNARILATMLNKSDVRKELSKKGIVIPESTLFIAAKHDTTTDEVTLYNVKHSEDLDRLRLDLAKAQKVNSFKSCKKRSEDWAEVRPEWGLARNAAFIIAPRNITKNLNLEGRCFLHSYDHIQDLDGKLLETILTAPMVVAQWINSQYLFSTLDNVSFGSGSKVTKNITGKIGIMQGNASDLMTGLPLQSVFSSDENRFHEPQRLMAVVYSPLSRLDPIISSQKVLKKLFSKGWVQLVCIEPESQKTHFLQRDLKWALAT